MHLPDLISDLGLILIGGSIMTIIFKRIRQPLVLGYIAAGFLIGPYFAYLPTVTDTEGIYIWSEIGIICLMFALGLEFSFHKLANVGATAIITAVTEACGLFLCGFAAGQLLGWGLVNSIVLGGILSMSSTTIIIKAFEELNLMGKDFTRIVFGALVVEDIIGIFIMVFMSTFAMGMGGGGGEFAIVILQLLFYLVLLLILGIFVIPTLLRKVSVFMNDETLLIVSLGICFGMVLLFSHIGFSTALGSFIAGSILAGTVFLERIEHLLKSVRDLFGAVFFISVGMMVDPAVLAKFWLPIIVISFATIIGKLFFTSAGVLLAGQRLKTSVRCGASLAQIGEFAFIIAALGTSLGLISGFIYPVVVSVSVITTFTTPFFIKNSENIYSGVKKVMPAKMLNKLDNYTSDDQSEKENDNYWKKFLKRYFIDMSFKVIIIFGILLAGVFFIDPFIENFLPDFGGRIVTVAIVLICMTPFLATLLYQRDKNFTMLLVKYQTNRLPLYVFLVLRVIVTVSLVMLTIHRFFNISLLWLIVPTIIFVVLLTRSEWLTGKYLQIEARFLANFNEKKLMDEEEGEELLGGQPLYGWVSEQLWVSEYTVASNSKEIGYTLKELKWRHEYKVDVIKIITDKKPVIIPDSDQKLCAKDVILFLSTKDHIEIFDYAVSQNHEGLKRDKDPMTLRDYIVSRDNEHNENQLFCYAITLEKGSELDGKNLRNSEMHQKYNCDIIGIQRDNYPIVHPDVQFTMLGGDQIWLLGGYKMVHRLIKEGLVQTEDYDLEEVLDGRR